MTRVLNLGDTDVDVVLKDIKNLHLSVHPPTGRVRIAAPQRMELETIRLFAISKLDWIRKQQRKLREQERETRREYLERESHLVWGKRYLMSLIEVDRAPSVQLSHQRIELSVRPDSNRDKCEQIVEAWYRSIVRSACEKLVEQWQDRIGVTVERLYVQRMRTRWGSCNAVARNIRVNTELGKKPIECLEYIVVHEMIHILEPTHNERFRMLMKQQMPDWQHRKHLLNDLPIRHEEWAY